MQSTHKNRPFFVRRSEGGFHAGQICNIHIRFSAISDNPAPCLPQVMSCCCDSESMRALSDRVFDRAAEQFILMDSHIKCIEISMNG